MNISEKIALLTREIMEKAEDEAENIIIEVENKAEQMLKESLKNKLSEHRILLKEQIDSLKRKEINMIADAEFKLRKDFMFKRQEFVEQIIEQSRNILLNLYKTDPSLYRDFVNKYILNGIDSINGDFVEIKLPMECKEFKNDIRKFLSEERPKVDIEISLGNHHVGPLIYSKDKKRVVDYSLEELVKINEDIFVSLVEEKLGEGYGKN